MSFVVGIIYVIVPSASNSCSGGGYRLLLRVGSVVATFLSVLALPSERLAVTECLGYSLIFTSLPSLSPLLVVRPTNSLRPLLVVSHCYVHCRGRFSVPLV